MSDGKENGGVNRRHVLKTATLAAAPGWVSGPAHTQDDGQVAVVFLSRSSNTRMLAGDLSRRFNAVVFEVRPRDPWPEDYEEMVAWATLWRESESLLPLEGTIDLSDCNRVFLGFPIWGGALPAPMRSFLSGHDLSGKTVVPFITHGGYGAGSSIDEISIIASDAGFADAFLLQCDQERDNLDALRGWLTDVSR